MDDDWLLRRFVFLLHHLLHGDENLFRQPFIVLVGEHIIVGLHLLHERHEVSFRSQFFLVVNHLDTGIALCIVGEDFGRVVGGQVVLHVQRPVGVMLFQNGVNLVWQVF